MNMSIRSHTSARARLSTPDNTVKLVRCYFAYLLCPLLVFLVETFMGVGISLDCCGGSPGDENKMLRNFRGDAKQFYGIPTVMV